MADIKDVARKSGCSISTVSRVINGNRYVKQDTRIRVQNAIRELGYIPNRNAQNMKLINTHTILVVVAGASNEYYTPIISIYMSLFRQWGYNLLIEDAGMMEDSVVDDTLRLVGEKNPNGVVFLGGDYRNEFDKLRSFPIPFLLSAIGVSSQDMEEYHFPNGSVVYCDDEEAIYSLTKYLIQNGHTDIALLAADSSSTIFRNRLKGYRKALSEHHLPFREERVFVAGEGNEAFSFSNGYQCIKKELGHNPPFSAVVTVSDTLAVGACRAILEKHLNIPADLCVTGMDGLSISEYFVPSITTVRENYSLLASISAEILRNRMEGRETVSSYQVGYEIIPRESTGPRRKRAWETDS